MIGVAIGPGGDGSSIFIGPPFRTVTGYDGHCLPRLFQAAEILNPLVLPHSLASHDSPHDAPVLLPSCLTPPQLSASELQQLNPIALAFLGDAVYELVVRQAYLLPPKRINDYHQQVVAQVRAERQAAHLRTIEPHLTETEIDWVRRGRNASPKSRRANPGDYQRATGLETLIGYLYLTDIQRLDELLGYLELVPA
jgi:ribonuclease III family protein